MPGIITRFQQGYIYLSWYDLLSPIWVKLGCINEKRPDYQIIKGLFSLTASYTLGARIYYMAFGWDACSRGAYMWADTLGARIYYMAIGCTLAAGVHICRLTRLERAYIIWPSAGTLAAGRIYVS